MTRHLRIIVIGLLSFVVASTSAAATMTEAELHDLFSQGKELFRQANELSTSNPDAAKSLYQRAAMSFERIARDGGIRNGKLYYNIGNAYFRMGDVGRAILNYRRAERLIPNDPNLRQNLNYAISRRIDKVELNEETKVLKTVFFWHYDLSSRTRLTAFAVCFALLWLFAGVRCFKRRAFVSGAIIAAAVLSALLLGSLLVESIQDARRSPGVVVAPEVIARKGNAETYQPSFKEPLHAGTEFDLLEQRGDWAHVELVDGRECWVPAHAIGMVRL